MNTAVRFGPTVFGRSTAEIRSPSKLFQALKTGITGRKPNVVLNKGSLRFTARDAAPAEAKWTKNHIYIKRGPASVLPVG